MLQRNINKQISDCTEKCRGNPILAVFRCWWCWWWSEGSDKENPWWPGMHNENKCDQMRYLVLVWKRPEKQEFIMIRRL